MAEFTSNKSVTMINVSLDDDANIDNTTAGIHETFSIHLLGWEGLHELLSFALKPEVDIIGSLKSDLLHEKYEEINEGNFAVLNIVTFIGRIRSY